MKQKMVFRRQRKRGKVAVVPGSRECNEENETNNCGQLRVRWKGPCALGEGGGRNMGVSK